MANQMGDIIPKSALKIMLCGIRGCDQEPLNKYLRSGSDCEWYQRWFPYFEAEKRQYRSTRLRRIHSFALVVNQLGYGQEIRNSLFACADFEDSSRYLQYYREYVY